MTQGLLLLNPNAGSMTDSLREALVAQAEAAELKALLPASADASERAVREAVDRGCPLLVAGGGDGTIHACAAVMLSLADQGVESLPTLGVVPLGTGNDLARTLGLSLDPLTALQETLAGAERRLDALRVHTPDGIHYAVNVVAGGFAGAVDGHMDDATKQSLGPLAYVTAALSALRELVAQEVTFELDGRCFSERIFNIVVANARTCGGGIEVAPAADPEDGLLDVALITESSLAELGGVVAKLGVGNILSSESAVHHVGRSLTLRGAEGLVFNVDGEVLERGPVRIEIMPRCLPMRVGPAYKRERWTLPPE